VRIFFAGGGNCTEYIARRLIREEHDLVLVEHDEERCYQLSEKLDAHIIQGKVDSIADWKRAGLADADMFMACTQNDETNVLACLIANDIAPDALKAIRLRNPEYEQFKQTFDRIGLRVDRVIHPETDMINRILRVITVPGVSDIRTFAEGRISLFSMNLENNSPLVGMRVGEFAQNVGAEAALIAVVFRGNEAIRGMCCLQVTMSISSLIRHNLTRHWQVSTSTGERMLRKSISPVAARSDLSWHVLSNRKKYRSNCLKSMQNVVITWQRNSQTLS
jgi:trk system potassium uptake protein TrkA